MAMYEPVEPGIVYYTVTFVDYDGTELKTQQVQQGGNAEAPSDPYREGYVFIGWDKSFENVSANLTVTAQYEKKLGPSIVVSNVKANAGESIVVPVLIKNNPGVSGAKITISYDSRLTLTKADKGAAFSVLDYTAPPALNSGCAFNWDSQDAVATEDGEILLLTFTVPADAASGTCFSVSFSYRTGDIYDVDLSDVTLTMIAGSITVN